MNLVRSVISLFLLLPLLLSVAGWMWAGGQPSPKAEGARIALGLCGLMAFGGMTLLWTTKQPRTG
jgi:hypothetical protein